MNQEQVLSLLRTLLQIGGSVAVTKGWTDEGTVVALTGALVTIAATAWGLIARSNKNLVVAAAAVPEVQQIVAAPKVAQAVPSAKVVAG